MHTHIHSNTLLKGLLKAIKTRMQPNKKGESERKNWGNVGTKTDTLIHKKSSSKRKHAKANDANKVKLCKRIHRSFSPAACSSHPSVVN